VQPLGGQAQIRGNIPIPSDGTTSSHNIKEDGNAIRTNGERPRYDIIGWEIQIFGRRSTSFGPQQEKSKT
jgi:hypothetical protein